MRNNNNLYRTRNITETRFLNAYPHHKPTQDYTKRDEVQKEILTGYKALRVRQGALRVHQGYPECVKHIHLKSV